MKEIYFETIMVIERLHRLFFDMVKAHLEHLEIPDLNNTQCFILYNIGKNKMSVGEISNRGYYLGSNVTYNLKKMVESGYVLQEPSPHDRRSSHIRLSKKGLQIYQKVDQMMADHAKNLKHNGLGEGELKTIKSTLQKLENFWDFATTHER